MNRIFLLVTALVALSAAPILAALDDTKDLGKTPNTEDLGNKEKKIDSDKGEKSNKLKKTAGKTTKKLKKTVKEMKHIVK